MTDTQPHVVTLGGGTGLPVLLRGLKQYTRNITAIVTVADDGGSSGELRRATGMLPPGDFRNNIAALSEAEELLQLLLQYRFGEEEGLCGHAFGNLLITAMAAIFGSFEAGILNTSKVLAVRGRVLPSTLESVTLCAEITDPADPTPGAVKFLRGESSLGHSGGRIHRVMLDPPQARAFPGAIQAILRADLVVAGPGSFFTSTLPNLIVTGIRQALQATKAPKLYVANILNQTGETDGFTLQDYLNGLDQHQLGMFHHILVNNRIMTGGNWASLEWIQVPAEAACASRHVHATDLLDMDIPWRHDAHKLAAALMDPKARWWTPAAEASHDEPTVGSSSQIQDD